MTSHWTRLASLLPKPESPLGLDRSWKAVEEELDLSLPNDYKQFVDLYGTGLICGAKSTTGYLGVWNYREKTNDPSTKSSVTGVTREYEDAKAKGYESPYPFYPDNGGLLPFANTLNADYFNWRMEGDPDKWDVVFYHSSTAEMVLLKGKTFIKCLLELLAQQSALIPNRISANSFAPPLRFTEVNW